MHVFSVCKRVAAAALVGGGRGRGRQLVGLRKQQHFPPLCSAPCHAFACGWIQGSVCRPPTCRHSTYASGLSCFPSLAPRVMGLCRARHTSRRSRVQTPDFAPPYAKAKGWDIRECEVCVRPRCYATPHYAALMLLFLWSGRPIWHGNKHV